MENSKDNYNWLCLAIQQNKDDKSEFYYYDKRKKEFFSILNLDFFLFDQKLNIIEGISPYYSIEELKLLQNRISKINKKSTSIVLIPRYGILNSSEEISLKIGDFLSENSIDIQSSSLTNIFQKEPILRKNNPRKTWWKSTSSLIHNILDKIR